MQRFPCSAPVLSQRSPRIVLPTPEGPVARVASPCLTPPFISSSSPGTPLGIRPDTTAAASGWSASIRGNTSMPPGPIRKVCLPPRCRPPRIFSIRSHRRSSGSRASYSSWMMPSANANSMPVRSSPAVYSPTSSSTVPVWAMRPVRSYSASRNSSSPAKSRSIFALSTTTMEGSSSSVFLTISDTKGARLSWEAGRRRSPRWMYSTRAPRAAGSKKLNSSRCLTSLTCGSDTVV